MNLPCVCRVRAAAVGVLPAPAGRGGGRGTSPQSLHLPCVCTGGELQQVVRFLRQEKEVASVELRLAQHELARLRSDLAIAQRAVLEANAQVVLSPCASLDMRSFYLCVCLPSRPSACHSTVPLANKAA